MTVLPARVPRTKRTVSIREWIVGFRRARFTVREPRPHRPRLLILLDGETELIADSTVVDADVPLDEAAAWVTGAIAQASGGPVRPARLRVEDPDLARVLAQNAAFVVEAAPAPELDPVMSFLEEKLRGEEGPGPALVPGPEVPADLAAAFFRAAARCHRAAPWAVATESQLVQVSALGRDARVAILGGAGESLGLAIFDSVADFVRMLERGEGDEDFERGPGVPMLNVSFDDLRSLKRSKAIAAQIKAAGWEAAKKAFPIASRVAPEGVPLDAEVDDYRLAVACLEAVATLVEEQAALFQAEDPERRTVVLDVPEVGRVSASAPPGDLAWPWLGRAIDTVREAAVAQARDGFREARLKAGDGERDADAAAHAAFELLEYKCRIDEPPLVGWSEGALEGFLLDDYPARGATPDEELHALPRRLAAFFQWLAASGDIQPEEADAMQECLERHRAEFLRRARDRNRFSPAKTLVRAMKAAGVDPGDEKAVAAFMNDFNARVREDPSLMPLPHVDRPRRKAWVREPGAPAPDPTAPCPCGSGRRYKKCCMPR